MEDDTHSFIIRIWRTAEDAEDEASQTTWRGSIDHVSSHQRLYFCQLEAVPRFIREQTGIGERSLPAWWVSVKNWFRLRMRSRNAR